MVLRAMTTQVKEGIMPQANETGALTLPVNVMTNLLYVIFIFTIVCGRLYNLDSIQLLNGGKILKGVTKNSV